MRDSMIFYRSFYEAIKGLPDEQFAACARAILAYGIDGETPEPGGIAEVVYNMAKPQIDKNNIRYENGTKGGRPKTKEEPNENQTETETKPNNNQTETKPEPNVNVNVNDYKRESTLKGTREKFEPPTVEQVKEYATEKGYAINADSFVDFYASKGWMVGKNKMKDWKAAVRNWNRSDNSRQEKTTNPVKKNQFNNFSQRDIDYDELERELLQRTYGGGT